MKGTDGEDGPRNVHVDGNPGSPGSTLTRDVLGAVSPIAEWHGTGDLEQDMVSIPFLPEDYDIDTPDSEQDGYRINARIRLSRYSLQMIGIDPAKVVCAVMPGNAMEPALRNGGVAAINTAVRTVEDGRTYAFLQEGELRIRMLYRVPGGGLRLRALNQAEHPEETISAKDIETLPLAIVGQVFWGASFM